MAEQKPKKTRQVFEARYEKGYRYLDRCGEAILILEELLPTITQSTWMPEEIAPAGARLKCPELDLLIFFDTSSLVVDQNPTDIECDFGEISRTVLATISARFDLRIFVRFGLRQFFMLGTDSVEDAEKLSVSRAPFKDWPVPTASEMRPKTVEIISLFENEQGQGYRFSVRPRHEVDAPLSIDDRLKTPSRLLPSGQSAALLNQLKRRKQRQESPIAGLSIDVDYYWVRPVKPDAEQFFRLGTAEVDTFIQHWLARK